MSHLLLTGGTGFFGRSLLRYWLEKTQESADIPDVTVLTRSPENFFRSYPEFQHQPWLQLHCGDIGQPDTLPHKTSFTHIVHAAADSTLGPRLTDLQRYDQIINGTRNLLEFAIVRNVKRFLFTSSGAVYGPQPSHLEQIPEDWCGQPDPLHTSSTYGVAKRTAEHLCTLYMRNYGLQTVIARCFAFVGPDLPLDVHFAIGNFIRDALWADEITVQGNGTPLRSYLDQQDLAHWLLTIMNHGKAGMAYNVGSDEEISISGLAHLVRDLVAPTKSVQIMGLNNDSKERNLYVPSIEKVRRELGLTVIIKLEDAIRTTARIALRQHI